MSGQWDIDNKARRKELRRAQYLKSPNSEVLRTRSWKMMKKFGLTDDQYEDMWFDQGGKCKICGGEGGERSLAVDHCHEAEKRGVMLIRGLLCHTCNNHLGIFEKMRAKFEKYLEPFNVEPI